MSRHAMALLAAVLAGCATAPDRLSENAARCETFGFERGTSIFLDCTTELTRLDIEIAAIGGRPVQRSTLGDIGHVLTSTANGIRAAQPDTIIIEQPPGLFRSGAVGPSGVNCFAQAWPTGTTVNCR